MDLASLMVYIMLNICFYWSDMVIARIMAYQRISNQLIEEYNDMPAQFGNSVPTTGLRVFAIPSSNQFGCNPIKPPPSPSSEDNDYPRNAKFAVIIERGGHDCTFEKKVRQAQASNYSIAIIYNNEGDDLEHMSAKNSTGIKIPSVFVGLTTGESLKSYYTSEILLVINDELPFNINTQLILPFSILIGLCCLVMIFYMIYKCIREQRRLRRHRLPKKLLKKLPIIRYSTKNVNLTYDTCVICLDEFAEGDKLRVLPCKHPYHSECIDTWLTQNKRDCPICKRKVFTKSATSGHARSRQVLDSLTDTDDDTTPLLQQSSQRVVATSMPTDSRTRHGTFGGSNNSSDSTGAGDDDGGSAVSINDTGTLLGGQTDTATDDEMIATMERRINPFDRTPNLPLHLTAQLNINVQRRSMWNWPIFRIFRRRTDISIAAPPYQEDILNDIIPEQLERYVNNNSRSRTAEISSEFQSSSNNILNPNLSGSFKAYPTADNGNNDSDDESPILCIYEPVNSTGSSSPNMSLQPQTSINDSTDVDSIFMQAPTHGGLGVAALPSSDNQLESRNRPRDTYGYYV